MNLAGVGAGMGNAIPGAEKAWQDIIAGRVRLQQAARQQQANEAFFKSLIPPAAAAMPQQGPPGMTLTAQRGGDGSYSVRQAARPPTAPAGGAPGRPGPPSGPAAGPGGAPPQASPPPAAPTAGGFQAPSGPAAGGAQFDPTQRLRAMAMQLKRANPGLDNQTLAVALDQQINAMKGLAPEDRIVMQMELAQQKFQMTRDIAGLRDDLERLQEGGRNTRAGNAEAGRNDRAALARQEAQAGQRSDARATTLPRAGVESDPTLSPVVGG